MRSESAGCELEHTGRPMFCRHCGSKTKENAKFCGACGKPIATAAPPPPDVPPAPSPNALPPHPEAQRLGLEVLSSSTESREIPEPRTPGSMHKGLSVKSLMVIMVSPLVVALVVAVTHGLHYATKSDGGDRNLASLATQCGITIPSRDLLRFAPTTVEIAISQSEICNFAQRAVHAEEENNRATLASTCDMVATC